ncbi:MAG: L-aspartate oxidase [Pseudomonadota bacterium]
MQSTHFSDQNHQVKADVLIIGSGAAGLTTALKIDSRFSVIILSKGPLTEANTYYAQGGVAAVLDASDSVDFHAADTIRAGGGLCREESVRFITQCGAETIQWLIDQGVQFTVHQGENTPHLTREGGHSHRRVVHAADATGVAIAQSLYFAVQQRPNIQLLSQRTALDLITSKRLDVNDNQIAHSGCYGAYVFNQITGEVEAISAKTVVLATGGASKAYLYTSNPDIATGDGIAMAWRAGCRVANLEFNQFHPTCLYHSEPPTLLITEAVRGEGGYLLRPDGSRFMLEFHPQAELAPRDVVARAIDHEMKRLGVPCMFLDIRHRGESFIAEHFPTVRQRLLERGIDMVHDLIPVVPAAHYTCGGVITDLFGRTDLAHLYAIGETGCTGLHGANRMASNSLLECVVIGSATGEHINQHLDLNTLEPSVLPWDASKVVNSDEDIVIAHNWHELRQFMWDYVGIVRTSKRLQRAHNRVRLLQEEIQEFYANYQVSNDLIELRNLALVSELIIRCALLRRESRGLHFTLDYPNTLAEARDSILTPRNAAQAIEGWELPQWS